MPDLLLEKVDGVVWITLNRPARHNAMSPEMAVRLADAWRDFRDDESLRVAVLIGAGEKAFCAGADLDRLIPLLTGARKPEDDWDNRYLADPNTSNVALLREFTLYKPVIAAINGYALAGGMELCLATDIRIATSVSVFGLPEVQRALVPSGGGLVRLPRQIGYVNAMRLLLTGETLSAEEACRVGLINEVVPTPEALHKRAHEIATTICANGPLAVRKVKEIISQTSGLPLDRAFKIETDSARDIWSSEDAKEGPRAFMEKRRPVWKGR